MAISEKNLPDLRKYLSTLPYVNKYNQTSQLINKFDNFDFAEHVGVLKILFEDLLNDFPFNNKWWIKYAEKYASINMGVRSIEIYQQASQANPSSVEIWSGYLSAILKAGTSESEFVIKNFEKAIECVHFDSEAEKIYESYLGYLESKSYQNHELTTDAFFWRLKNLQISEAEKYIARYEKFIDSIDQPIYYQIVESHTELNLSNEKIFKRELLKNAYANNFKNSIGKVHFGEEYKKLLQLMDNKTDFDGIELNAKNIEAIKELLHHSRKVGNHQKAIFLYRRALVFLANDGAFWTEYLHLLDSHESTKTEVDNCFKTYTHHFKVIKNKEDLLFYQAEFKEARKDISGAREAYAELEKLGNFEAYIRHIYMEIRTNHAQNVFEVFSSLSKIIEDPDQMIFALQEIGDILNKLGDADRAIDIIKQFSEKGDFSKFFLATWVNFLKSCQKPWDDLEEVFLYSLSKAKTLEDKHEIWKLYLYTARGYCNNVNLIREIERKYAIEHDFSGLENGVNKKRKLDNPDNEEKELRKQVKSD